MYKKNKEKIVYEKTVDTVFLIGGLYQGVPEEDSKDFFEKYYRDEEIEKRKEQRLESARKFAAEVADKMWCGGLKEVVCETDFGIIKIKLV